VYKNLEKEEKILNYYFFKSINGFFGLMETYLHEHSFFISFDLFVVNRRNHIDYTFGSIRVEMPFSGINCFSIRT
jgi:hypothetical protein